MKMKTFFIHGKFKSKKWDYDHHIIPPMSSSSAFRLVSAKRGAKGFEEFACNKIDVNKLQPIYIYDRLDEPTRGMLEENLARAEGGDVAVCFGSGMAAVSAAFGSVVKSSDEIICHKMIYGCTFSLLTNWYPKYKINVKFVDMKNKNELKKSITKKTKVVYFETPANPTLELIDIKEISRIVRAYNRKTKTKIYVIVDNTFATPFCQRPLTLGADIVVHSLTKGIGGFGTDMGGAVITGRRLLHDLLLYRKDFGGVLPPKSAWPILVYGVSSLSVRIKTQQESARKVAEFLKNNKKIENVVYPGFDDFTQIDIAKKQMIDYDGGFSPGIMIYFTIKNKNKVLKFLNYIAERSYAITLAVSLGQIRTLIESPSLMTHSTISIRKQKKLGFDIGGVRMSVGLEDVNDIIKDLNSALKVI